MENNRKKNKQKNNGKADKLTLGSNGMKKDQQRMENNWNSRQTMGNN